MFPHAPAIPVTINGGMVMPAWYDIETLELVRRHDEEGIQRSSAHLTRLIARENERGIPCERIFLAGFSQGGAISTHVALRHPERLAGLIALSTYLVRGEELEAERSRVNLDLPVFQAHGTMDPMVVYERGTDLRDRLVSLGYPLEFHDYPMMHQVCLEELEALGSWMKGRLSAG